MTFWRHYYHITWNTSMGSSTAGHKILEKNRISLCSLLHLSSLWGDYDITFTINIYQRIFSKETLLLIWWVSTFLLLLSLSSFPLYLYIHTYTSSDLSFLYILVFYLVSLFSIGFRLVRLSSLSYHSHSPISS